MITDNAIKIEPQGTADSTIIWLHGLGADGHDFADLPKALNHPSLKNTRCILPHAPLRPVTLNGSMPMRAWHDITSLTREGRQDLVGLEASHQLVEQLINEQIEQGIAANRILLGGFSQGGAQVLYSGTRTKHPIAGIIALSCYLPDPENTPAPTAKPPILMMHGTQDEVVLPEFGEESFQALQQNSYDVDFQRYDVGHGICPEQIIYLNDWLGKQLS
jgi:phospholipase/carboxylesterase